MRGMQVERGKTRPQTLMTGHTGYITHARKILKTQPQSAQEQLPREQEKRGTAEEPPAINLSFVYP